MKARKPTGELKLFRQIWDELKNFERISYVSGTHLYEFSPANFHHVLPKGKYPELRLNKHNIMLLTLEEHRMVDNIARSVLEKLPGWSRYFEYYDTLRDKTLHRKP